MTNVCIDVIIALLQASSVRIVQWQLILPAGVKITLLLRQMRYIHVHVCQTFHWREQKYRCGVQLELDQ